MGEYTVVLVYEWSKYGVGIKDIFKNHRVKWNSGKKKNLKKDEILDIYKKFKVENDDIVNKEIELKGKSGIWENADSAIKIVMIDGKDIAIIIYKKKTDKDKAWKDFVKYSKDCGSLIQFIEEGEVVFRDRVNVELINMMNNKNGERDVIIKSFMIKADGYRSSFKERWISCIMK